MARPSGGAPDFDELRERFNALAPAPAPAEAAGSVQNASPPAENPLADAPIPAAPGFQPYVAPEVPPQPHPRPAVQSRPAVPPQPPAPVRPAQSLESAAEPLLPQSPPSPPAEDTPPCIPWPWFCFIFGFVFPPLWLYGSTFLCCAGRSSRSTHRMAGLANLVMSTLAAGAVAVYFLVLEPSSSSSSPSSSGSDSGSDSDSMSGSMSGSASEECEQVNFCSQVAESDEACCVSQDIGCLYSDTTDYCCTSDASTCASHTVECCDVYDECQYDGDTCQDSCLTSGACSAHDVEDCCNGDSDCAWDSAYSVCVAAGCSYESQYGPGVLRGRHCGRVRVEQSTMTSGK